MSRYSKKHYLGHANLKEGLRLMHNKAITPAGLDDSGTPDTNFQSAEFAYSINGTNHTVAAKTDIEFTTSTHDVASSKYAAFVVTVASSGNFTITKGADESSKVSALAALDDVSVSDDEAVVGVLVIKGAFTAGTTTVRAGTDAAGGADFYSCGGMSLSSGKSTDGDDLLAAL